MRSILAGFFNATVLEIDSRQARITINMRVVVVN